MLNVSIKMRVARCSTHPDPEVGFFFFFFPSHNELPRTVIYNHTAIIWTPQPNEHSVH